MNNYIKFINNLLNILIISLFLTHSVVIADSPLCNQEFLSVTSPKSQNKILNDVIWVEKLNQFIAVGDSIHMSPDGVNWKTLSTQVNKIFNKLISNGSQIIAIGDNGVIISSTNGITWQQQDSGISERLIGIEWNGDYFFVIGADGTLLKSKDGLLWQNVLAKNPTNFKDILWTGDRWILTATEDCAIDNLCNTDSQVGIILSSKDGNVWAKEIIGVGHYPGDIHTTGSEFIIPVEYYCITCIYHLRSSDGLNWTSDPDYDYSQGVPIVDIITASNKFIGLGIFSAYFSSSDGIEWSKIKAPIASINAIATNTLVFVAVGVNGGIVTSFNGITWNKQSLEGRKNLNDILYRNGQYIAVGDGGTILTSINGQDWIRSAYNTLNTFNGKSYNEEIKAISSNDNIIVAVGGHSLSYSESGISNNYSQRGIILTSTDGVSWNSVGIPDFVMPINDVFWNGKIFVAVSQETILSSHDGKTWNTYSIPDPAHGINFSNAIIWDGKQFLIQAKIPGYFYSSHDGIVWNEKSSNAVGPGPIAHNGDYYILSNIYNSEFFTGVALGDYDINEDIYKSSDGITWAPLNADIKGTPETISWTGESFLSIIRNNIHDTIQQYSIYTSKNGAQWDKWFSTNTYLSTVISTPDGMIAVGESGAIYKQFCQSNTQIAAFTEATGELNIPSVVAYNVNGELVYYNHIVFEYIPASDPVEFILKSVGSIESNINMTNNLSTMDALGTIKIPKINLITSKNVIQQYYDIFFQLKSTNDKITAELIKVGQF